MKSCNGLIVGVMAFIFIFSSALPPENPERVQKANSNPNGIIVPIFMYHEVKTFKTRKDVITPAELESDLKYLKAEHYTTVTMTNLIHYVNGKESLPEKPIILSFDDGYYNNYVYAFPLLKKYNLKIVLSIIGKNTDAFSRISDVNLDYSNLTWDQIDEMVKSGLVEIQNHTYNMHSITPKRFGCAKNKCESPAHYEQAIVEDIGLLQQEILSHTGTAPNTFTYPYGRVSKESYPIIKELGFQASLTCDYGVNIITKDPEVLFGLKRICRVHGVPIQTGIEEALKTLKYRS